MFGITARGKQVTSHTLTSHVSHLTIHNIPTFEDMQLFSICVIAVSVLVFTFSQCVEGQHCADRAANRSDEHHNKSI